MRRFIGQFGDVAEEAVKDGVTDIITAAISGCIIGEYVALLMDEQYHHPAPVSHMVFLRSGSLPIQGILPETFSLAGNHVMIADDAVMETRTAAVMLAAIRELKAGIQISILSVDIDPETKYSAFMKQFAHVYTFDE